MIHEAVRIVGAVLRDGSTGVGALLATMPLDGSDTRATTPTILDETSDSQTALDQYPDGAGPWLQVGAGALREQDITVTPSRKTEVDLAIRYSIRSSLTTKVLGDARQVERAIRRVLSQLPQQSNSVKLRNQAQLFHVTNYTANEARTPTDDIALAIVMQFTVHGRDLRTMDG